jgi:creatinine amidohydrolase
VLLEKMTFGEIQNAITEGRHDVVVPCGAVEQHGRHLPLDVDAVHADRLALEVAERLGTALVAPTIRVGVSPHHMAFPGTISLRPETFEAVYSDYCRSLAAHGFRTILCFSGHGGNFAPLAEMEQRLDDLVGPDCQVIVFSDLLGLVEVWRSAVDVAESSVYSYLRPGDVRTDQLERGFGGRVDDAVLERLFTGGIKALSDTGVMGDPHGFSSAIGAACVQRVADMLAGHFTERMRLTRR